MEKLIKKKVKMVSSPDARTFEIAFNTAMEFLADKNPTASAINYNNGFWASITYEEVENVCRTVSDEFHLEGIVMTCRACPYHEEVSDKRKKMVPCKYSSYGMAHLDHEACEFFYKQLKQGAVVPEEV